MTGILGNGCLAAPRAVQLPIGEPIGAFPSWEERVVHVLVNRARADPAAELTGCTACGEAACYEPVPPVEWSFELARAARFHSAMVSHWGRGLTHNSPCALRDDVGELYAPGACDGEASCACAAEAFDCDSPASCASATCPTCTSFSRRAQLFGASASAENMARAADPAAAMRAWLTEPYDRVTCGFGVDSRGRPNGHRFNILAGDRRTLGVGFVGGVFTQDFASRTSSASGFIAAAHMPGAGSEVAFRANWYAPFAPVDVRLNVDGMCSSMRLERGTGMNGTYVGSPALAARCVHYRVEATTATGTMVYPSTGSFSVGCPEDWSSDAVPSCCERNCDARSCGPDGCGGVCGTCAPGEACGPRGTCHAVSSDAGPSESAPDSETRGSRDAATSDSEGWPFTEDARSGRDSSPPSGSNDAGRTRGTLVGTCGCRASSGRSAVPHWLWVPVAVLMLRRRRRPYVGASCLALIVVGCSDPAPTRTPFDTDSRADAAAFPDAAPLSVMDASTPAEPDATHLVDADDARSADAPSLFADGFNFDVEREAEDAGAGADDAGAACVWSTALDLPGEVHVVTLETPQRVVRFLRSGEGFGCARISVTMQTQNNLGETDLAFEGCPIFSHILGLEGTTAGGRNLGSAYFRLLRLDCSSRRPGAIQLDAWGDPGGRSETDTSSAWRAGERYRMQLEVTQTSSILTVFDSRTTAQLGPSVPVDISGTTVDMTRDAQVILGLSRVFDGAYFPYYGAVYSDLRIEVAPPR